MAEPGLGDLRKRDGPANAVSASVSAVGGLRSSRYRTLLNRESQTCQWQNGTFRCEFGTAGSTTGRGQVDRELCAPESGPMARWDASNVSSSRRVPRSLAPPTRRESRALNRDQWRDGTRECRFGHPAPARRQPSSRRTGADGLGCTGTGSAPVEQRLRVPLLKATDPDPPLTPPLPLRMQPQHRTLVPLQRAAPPGQARVVHEVVVGAEGPLPVGHPLV